MKKIYFLFSLLVMAVLNASAQFITVWKTDNPGVFNNSSITIPATGNQYSIAWEEVGNPANNGTATGSGTQVLSFPSPGTYQVSISPGSGTFSRIAFANSGDRNKLLEIKQWGDIRWTSMENAFQGCTNLTISATDAPDLQDVASLAGMFESCAALATVPEIDQWDVSGITNMARLFYFASTFNAPLGSWNMGSVTNMHQMFHSASAFNQPIGSWDVSKVTNMNSMFYQARAFDESIENWNVSNVTNMGAMFTLAPAFNKPLEKWNVGQVTDMSNMFYGATLFNQSLDRWDVSKVRNMTAMFVNATAFNQPLGRWNLNAVTTMVQMLLGSGMQCASMTLTLQGWAGNAATPDNITFGANGRNYGSQAAAALATLRDTKGWTIAIGSEVTCALPPRPYVAVWKTDNPGRTADNQIMIAATGTGYSVAWEEVGNAANFGTTTGSDLFTLTLPHAGTYQLSITPGNGTFTAIRMSARDPQKLLEVKQWGDIRWSDMEQAYYRCVNMTITAGDLPDLRDVRSMRAMFSDCRFTTVAGLDKWDVGNVTDMSALFMNSPAFNQSIADWDTKNVTDMNNMFSGATSFNQPIGRWNVSKVRNMTRLFLSAHAFNQPIGDWDVSQVGAMEAMFRNAFAFDQPIGDWNVSSVTDMSYMLLGARSFNQPLENWDVRQVRNFSHMMFSADAFSQELGKWNLSSAINLTGMLSHSGMDCEHVSRTLMAWAANTETPDGLTLDAQDVAYASAARTSIDYLRDTKGWTITLGAEVPCAALDVSLVSFNVSKAGGQVKVNWITASETDNDYFEIERSADARTWTSIARIDGAGTTTTTRIYSHTDVAPLSPKAYYRLKTVDLAGKTEYSAIRAAVFAEREERFIYPNPATTSATFSGKPGSVVQIYNATGRKVLQITLISEKTTIPLSGLPGGVYLIRSDEGWQGKFVKK
ncbi:BspA family leucine-rich repeat surface protein [Dyadobacter fermentans]|uniref:Lipoprotein n=1 Tax=Dyadobacter fermentans (strain ATCC 700827 / DSM 18053 / CIP 107007 / KCTC 52180 / NS114) TaxID=471854 RepID=C6VTQ6_DYAFD|nr:BspA family leucine-rich repeat surface protein [Dyadobacter fermentans]ACT92999.1 lipoprotein [Dyadobacter fermentans DSM 18053]